MDAIYHGCVICDRASMGSTDSAAVCMVTVYWNHIVTIADEFKYIWKRPFGEMKILFILCRYTVVVAMAIISACESGFLQVGSDKLCKISVATYGVMASCVCMIAHYVLVIRLYALWDYRKRVIYVLRAGYIGCTAISFVFLILTIRDMTLVVTFDNTHHVCIIPSAPQYKSGIWAAQLLFELFALGLTFLNAASRPRTVHIKILSDLIRDGILFNTGVFLLHLCAFALSFPRNPIYFVLSSIADSAIISTVGTRAVLRVEELLSRSNPRSGVSILHSTSSSGSE
ncbi:hypothetical protein BC834DRAFT_896458 [Gloeopeniophorella convolvens]|nr:hypothetical protein BC834DRAFT_896458 [Gloeopeniophorella convolvens]